MGSIGEGSNWDEQMGRGGRRRSREEEGWEALLVALNSDVVNTGVEGGIQLFVAQGRAYGRY